ncbi:MAG: hypothetical protein PHG85_02780 [Candidatus Altiarchaeota archaeon]|nr:hypothetical protein [Candidatus Altiarchaeota archaeon]
MKYTAAIALMLALMLTATGASAIGVTPGTINLSKMVRGGYAEKTLYISNAGREDVLIGVKPAGGIKNWLSFGENQTTLLIPERSYKPLLVKISVPNTAPNGYYEGYVIINAIYQGNSSRFEENTIIFMPGLIVKILVRITGEEITGYALKSVTVADTEKNKPATVNAIIENTGNIIARPRIHYELLDSEKKRTGKTFDQTDMPVLPTVVKQFTAQIDTAGLDTGPYYMMVTTDNGGEQIAFFHVLEPGTLAIRGLFTQLALNKIWTAPGETVRADATFTNAGETVIEQAKLKCESYLIDEESGSRKLVGVFNGDPIDIQPGVEATLSAYYTPKEYGKYQIEGFVVYSGRKSESKSTILNVAEQVQKTIYSELMTLISNNLRIILIVGSALLLLAVYIARKHTGRHKDTEAEQIQPKTEDFMAAEKQVMNSAEWVERRLITELSGMSPTSIILVSVESSQHSDAVSALLRIVVTETGVNSTYISISLPYQQLMQVLAKNNVPPEKLSVVDCISRMAGQKPEAGNAFFVEMPSYLEEVALYTERSLSQLSEPKFIFLDSLSSLMIYNDAHSVEQFTHLLINKMRLEKFGGIIISIKQKENEALVKTLVPMCDKEIIL